MMVITPPTRCWPTRGGRTLLWGEGVSGTHLGTNKPGCEGKEQTTWQREGPEGGRRLL